MGCDIHLYVEVRENGEWKSADRWYNNPEESSLTEEFYDGRNYDLFGILANVRNGRGFAGIKTGEGFNPISEPRGLPPDVSSLVKAVSDRWNGDGHSHSYFTVAELLAYDWTQVSCLQGWVNGPTFAEWNRWGRSHGQSPKTCCGMVTGPNIEHISTKEMEKRLRETEDNASLFHTYCLAEWTEPYYKAAGSFISETMPRLWHLGKPEDVRIVFWFDN